MLMSKLVIKSQEPRKRGIIYDRDRTYTLAHFYWQRGKGEAGRDQKQPCKFQSLISCALYITSMDFNFAISRL